MSEEAKGRNLPPKFTDTFLKKLMPRDKRYRLTDAGCEGLMIEVGPTGSKSWQFRYMVDGKRVVLSLKKSYPAFSLAKARDKVREFQAQIADGVNPMEELKAMAELKAKEEAEPPP